eukprot:1181401-Prorocentrum_minimum.AAC.2
MLRKVTCHIKNSSLPLLPSYLVRVPRSAEPDAPSEGKSSPWKSLGRIGDPPLNGCGSLLMPVSNPDLSNSQLPCHGRPHTAYNPELLPQLEANVERQV